MILSNQSLQDALDKKWIVIDPEPSPRRPSQGAPCPYETTSVDFHLADEIAYIKPGLPFNVDLSQGKFSKLFGPNSESVTITDQQPFVLQPSRLVLARTRERIELPIQPDGVSFAGRVEGKSSYARFGLIVHLTAPTIHAGFFGTIMLELINLGAYPITLRPDIPICQVIFETVDGVPFRNDSQFHGQSRAGGHA